MKKDDEMVLNVPVNAGIVGVVIAPLASVVAVVAAFGFKCTIEVIKNDGTIIDVSDAVTDAMGTVVEKSSTVMDEVKEKGNQMYQKGKEKAEEAVNKIRKDSEEIDFSECFDEDDTDAGIEAEDETSIEVDDIAEAADMVAEEAAAEAGEEKEDAAEKEEK